MEALLLGAPGLSLITGSNNLWFPLRSGALCLKQFCGFILPTTGCLLSKVLFVLSFILLNPDTQGCIYYFELEYFFQKAFWGLKMPAQPLLKWVGCLSPGRNWMCSSLLVSQDHFPTLKCIYSLRWKEKQSIPSWFLFIWNRRWQASWTGVELGCNFGSLRFWTSRQTNPNLQKFRLYLEAYCMSFMWRLNLLKDLSVHVALAVGFSMSNWFKKIRGKISQGNILPPANQFPHPFL